ncbi:neuroligin-1 [Caerostris extrusa]|uniref:Neuroligin-1 n=1 Tax=Caerostris extrusa TaxID=172846 RepID=A0AAV4QM49_CAEEX|nr:neuroligin-1 [Caerostris extrusa]
MMSGSALSPWAIARDANLYAVQIGRTLGCPIEQPATLLECLRERSVADILRNEPATMMEELANEHQYGLFDLMFGVTRVESYLHISDKEDKNGMQVERRDKLLRTLVRNIYTYHLQEIFLTIVNEYTDWTKAIQHDTNILDGTMDALGDALVVAPIVRTANYHSVSPRKSYFYVFNYQLEDSKYNQRQGCVSGEDLQFVFGAPLIGTLGHFSKNYSQTEVVISEAVMTYFVNFARNGDPNSQQSEKPQDKTKARFEKVIWPVYDKTHQNFLMLGAKPKVRDHYHAHRLSFWLNLFPKLHATSSVNASPEHHLLDDHYNPQSYDGEVRKMPYDLSKSLADAATHAPPGQQTTETSKVSGHLLNILLSTIHPDYQVTTENITLHEASNITEYKDGSEYESNYSKYSAAIGISIAGGISLLLLNVLVFSGIYYQRDRNRSELMIHKRIVMQQAMERQLSGKLDQIPPPPPAPACQTASNSKSRNNKMSRH